MKKAMNAALCILSAFTMTSAFAVSASAGTLSREELIEKYMPNGAEDELYFNPGTEESFYDAEGELIDVIGYMQQKTDELKARAEAGEISEDELDAYSAILVNETLDLVRSTDYRVQCFNDYRRGVIFNRKPFEQYFTGAEYEKGFWYILQADGTASIVGAEQADMNGRTVLEIPAEIGGVPVTKIEDRAFESAYRFFADMTEIVIPDSVEVIGEGAFSCAFRGTDCKINLPANVKYIGKGAFYESANWLGDEFHVIELPETLEFIGYRAFAISESQFNVSLNQTADPFFPDYTVKYSPLHGFFGKIHCLLDMPESAVMIEEKSLLSDYGSCAPNGYADVSYAAVNDVSLDELDAIMKTLKYEEQTGLYVTSRPEGICGPGMPDWAGFNTVAGFDAVLAFCDKYDMTRQLRFSKYAFGDNSCTFLYDEGNFVDMDDVKTYLASKTAEPKPATIAKGSGDVNCDGGVDVSDSVLLARFCTEDRDAVLTAEGKANADVNADGNLTMDDVTAIQYIIAKLS